MPEDRYQFGEPIGRDGMATIYRARDMQADRIVAIKVLRDDYITDPKFVEQFQRGAEAQKAVHHPNVVQVYDYGQTNEKYFVVMELVEGTDLRRYLHFPPEQAQGNIVSPAADVYSLGIVMYDMLTGRPAFDGDTPVAVAMAHIQDPPQPPSQLNPNIPQGLEALILRCLEKQPEKRYQNGDELARALEIVR